MQRLGNSMYRPASPRARAPHPVGSGVPAASVVRPQPAPVRSAPAPAAPTGLWAATLDAWHCLQDFIAPKPAATPDPTGGHGHETTHTVQPGDTLSKIAQQHLGDMHRWNEIF